MKGEKLTDWAQAEDMESHVSFVCPSGRSLVDMKTSVRIPSVTSHLNESKRHTISSQRYLEVLMRLRTSTVWQLHTAWSIILTT